MPTEKHEHTLTGDELDKVMLDVWMSGFKSGIGSIVGTSLSREGVPDAVLRLMADRVASGLATDAFEDPAFRETALEACRGALRNHFHPGSDTRTWHLKMSGQG